MESEFPSNSNMPKKTQTAKTEPKKIQKVIQGEAIQRKKPLGKRFAEVFTGADSKSVGTYVLFEIAVPQIKDLVADIINMGVERKLYGEVRSTSRRGGFRPGGLGAAGYTAYNRMNQQAALYSRSPDPREPIPSRRARANHNFDEIVIPTRAEAIEVLDQLYSLLSQYEVVSVSDLYNMIGVTPAFTDERWGWTSLGGSDISRVRDGYLLDLPRPEPLD